MATRVIVLLVEYCWWHTRKCDYYIAKKISLWYLEFWVKLSYIHDNIISTLLPLLYQKRVSQFDMRNNDKRYFKDTLLFCAILGSLDHKVVIYLDNLPRASHHNEVKWHIMTFAIAKTFTPDFDSICILLVSCQLTLCQTNVYIFHRRKILK